MIRALLFDVFGTLVDWRGGVAREAATFLQSVGRTDVDPGHFADLWRAEYVPAMRRIISGERPYCELDTLHRENLDRVLEKLAINNSDQAALASLNRAWHRLDPWPDVPEGLCRLHENYVVAPCSNGHIALMIDLARHGRLRWDAILGAEVAGTYKPAPQAYLRSVAALGLAPAEVCMVAAHPSDLAAAKACGLSTAYLYRPLEYGPVGQPPAPREGFDFWASDLFELAHELPVTA